MVCNLQQGKFIQTLKAMESEHKRERDQLEQVILELQAQLYNLKSDHMFLQQRVQSLTASQQVALGQIKEIQMTDMADVAGDNIPSHTHRVFMDNNSEQHSLTSSTEVGQLPSQLLHPDNRSLMSNTSEQLPQITREDSQSLIPLTGSLTSLGIKGGDPLLKEEVVTVVESSRHSVSHKQEFENVSLQEFEDVSNGNLSSKGDTYDVIVSKIQNDTLKTSMVVSKTPGVASSTGSESPVMVTSSESDEPVHITLEDVSQNITIDLNDAETEESNKGSSTTDEVATDEHENIPVEMTDNQSNVELNRSSDSSSSTEEPVHLSHESLEKGSSDSGSSDTASWEVTHDRDLHVTSGEEQVDKDEEEQTEH